MKERGRRLGLVLWSSVYDYTSPTVTGFQARKARNTSTSEVCVSSFDLVSLNIFFRATRTQQYRGFELDRQETSATEVHMSSLDIVGSNLF